MKKILMIFSLVSFSKFVFSQENDKLFETKEFNKSFPKVEASSEGGGSIYLMGSNSGSSKVEVFIMSNRSKVFLTKEEIQKILDEDYSIKIEEKAGKLLVSADRKNIRNHPNNSLTIDFKIFTGTNTSSEISTSGGNIELTNIQGNQNFETSGGSILLENVSGKIKGQTSGGNIKIKNCSNQINLTTSGGNIKAEDSKGNLNLITSGGNIYFKNLEGQITGTTSGGDISADNIFGSFDANTSGGNIDMKNLNCSLNTATSGGNINVDFTKPKDFVTISNTAGKINIKLPNKTGISLDLKGKEYDRTFYFKNFSNYDGDLDSKTSTIHGKLFGGGVPVKVKLNVGKCTIELK